MPIDGAQRDWRGQIRVPIEFQRAHFLLTANAGRPLRLRSAAVVLVHPLLVLEYATGSTYRVGLRLPDRGLPSFVCFASVNDASAAHI